MPAGTALPRPVLNEPTRSLARLRAVEVLVGTNELANLTHPGRLRKSCSNNGNVHFRQVQSINPSTGSINFRSSDSRGVLAQARTLGDELIVADADLDACNFNKSTIFNFAAHRRPEHYGIITGQAGATPPPEA